MKSPHEVHQAGDGICPEIRTEIIHEWGGDGGDTRAKVGTRGSSLLEIYPCFVDASQGNPCVKGFRLVHVASDIFMGRERLMLCGKKD